MLVSTVLTFSAGFHLGFLFAYFVWITSCTTQRRGISVIFRNTLTNHIPHQKKNRRERAQAEKTEGKFFFSFACFTQFSSCSSVEDEHQDFVELSKIRFPRFAKLPFPWISEFFFWRHNRGSMSRSIGRRFDRNDMRKMWISLENENSRLVFMQVTSTKTNLQGI